MIKQIILLFSFLLALSGCDGFWENLYFVDKLYEGKVWENDLVQEALVLRDTLDTPSPTLGYLFERAAFAEGAQKDDVNRILLASFLLIPAEYDPKKMILGKKYRVSAKFSTTGQVSGHLFCKVENYRPCVEKYDLATVGFFRITSIEPLP